MYRNITAVYRTHETADLVRRELSELGVSTSDIHVVPDRDEAVSSSGYRDDHRYADDLHGLHLPDADLRTYQQCVRRGDYVVSVEVEEDYLQRAQEIMRRPEEQAHNLDSRDTEFNNEQLIGHSSSESREVREEWRGRRDSDSTDPYTRAYVRDAPLTRR